MPRRSACDKNANNLPGDRTPGLSRNNVSCSFNQKKRPVVADPTAIAATKAKTATVAHPWKPSSPTLSSGDSVGRHGRPSVADVRRRGRLLPQASQALINRVSQRFVTSPASTPGPRTRPCRFRGRG